MLVVTVLVSGCMEDDPNRRAKTGAGIGALAGAAAGYAVDQGAGGLLVGAAVGALAGGSIGHYMDNQQRDFEAALAEEQRQNELEIQRMQDETLKLSLNSEVSFALNKSDIKPAFYPTLDKLAEVLQKYNQTVVHVVGFTDSTGSYDYNMALSQRRADSVARYLEQRGVPYSRVRTEGRGENEPRETNSTEAGRQLNRRVEIYIKPIVEGQEQKAYESPRY